MKVILTGGGTGGHIYPALSIAAALRADDPGVELLFIGSSHGPEGRLAAEAGLRFIGLPSKSFGGGLSLSNFVAISKLALAFVRALAVLRAEKPNVVIGTGGYTSAAVMLASRYSMTRARSMIHEQNALPGRTNLFVSRFVDRVCVTFEESADYFPPGKVVVTGLPIRPTIFEPREKAAARVTLGLKPDLFTIFVCGGSQGARRINEMILEAAPALIRIGAQVLHQTGQKNYEEVAAKAPDLDSYKAVAYLDEPADAYWAADLIVCRSGASTLAELCAVGLPAILIPFPFAYADHQTINARVLEKHGAAILVEEASSSPEQLVNQIGALIRDPKRLRSMSAASKALARPDAAEQIVQLVTNDRARYVIAPETEQ